MQVIKVVTDDGGAYYRLVSRLKKTSLKFVSVSPSEVSSIPRGPVITTKRELRDFDGLAFAIEDLDENPLIMEAQILSRLLDTSKRTLLVGVDPGLRIGAAVFYGGKAVGTLTTNSVEKLVSLLRTIVGRVPHSALVIKIGDGEPESSLRLAMSLREVLPKAAIEIVDEAGTSTTRRGTSRGTRDQRAAIKIAFRRGIWFTSARVESRV